MGRDGPVESDVSSFSAIKRYAAEKDSHDKGYVWSRWRKKLLGNKRFQCVADTSSGRRATPGIIKRRSCSINTEGDGFRMNGLIDK